MHNVLSDNSMLMLLILKVLNQMMLTFEEACRISAGNIILVKGF